MFESVLIANRSEIACRIIRTLKQRGIRAIAVHSEADRDAAHVQLADAAVEIGPPQPLQSYLNVDAVLAAARDTGAAAIHPGYGFLSENETFARRVVDAGMTWIGPQPEAIARMGDKQQARGFMAEAGVPIVPGADVGDLTHAESAAAALGFPVMLKAAHGGGGIGMAAVHSPADLAGAWETARVRAERAFGSGVLYLEKYVAAPHHVEIQVFGDTHGNVVHIFERECSVQRRHQKVIEESPSPFISTATREAMCAAAVAGAAAIGYRGAGTLEFLVDADQNFYFLEMNTRLQVEHPVTEEITGLDLVDWQLQVAAGKPLPVTQADLRARGHALEFRIYAENPKKFLPSPGTLETLTWPEGEGLRIETGVRAGDTITPFYDPMIAKLVVRGDTRAAAIDRARAALQNTVVEGIKTNIPFLLEVLDDDDFQAGNYTTHLIRKLRPGLA